MGPTESLMLSSLKLQIKEQLDHFIKEHDHGSIQTARTTMPFGLNWQGKHNFRRGSAQVITSY